MEIFEDPSMRYAQIILINKGLNKYNNFKITTIMRKEIESIFKNNEFGQLRVFVDTNGKTWIAGVDVAKALGFKNPSNAVKNHCRQSKTIKHRLNSRLNNGKYDLIFIEETNFYRLVIKSTLPSAEKFQDWVVEEILPSLRETGQYSMVEEKPAIQNNQNNLEEINKALGNKVNHLINRNKLLAEDLIKYRLYCLDEIAEEFGIKITTLEAILEDRGFDLESVAYVKSGAKYVDNEGKGMVKDIVNGLGRKEAEVPDVEEAFVNLVAFHYPSDYDEDLYPLDALPF